MPALLDGMSLDEREQLRAKLAQWEHDPVLFVHEVFGATPDPWQFDGLIAIDHGEHPRTAFSACKGPGKSCSLAWTIWWWLATRPDAQIICTSITRPNLQDNLWKELSFWQQKSPLLQALFTHGGDRIVSVDSPKTWWCSARGWSQDADSTQQANTLAGLHGQYPMIVLDEVGDYPRGVLAAAEGIFANDVQARLVVAGNPTRTDGPLYDITSKDRKRWNVIVITGDPDDPKRSPRISLEWARQLIEDYGREHDWVRVNLLGQFPRVGSDKILGPDDVIAAEKRACLRADYESEPIIFGLDVARMGDDRSVLYKRQGSVAWKPWVWRKTDTTALADNVAHVMRQEVDYDYLVIDMGGPGAGVYDRLRFLGFEEVLIPIDFGGSPLDARYADRGTEAWMAMADWVRKRGCLPANDGELASELTTRAYGYRIKGKRTAFALESKDHLKARGVNSPDKADGLALTFAAPLGPRPRRKVGVEAALYHQGEGRYLTEDDVPVFRD